MLAVLLVAMADGTHSVSVSAQGPGLSVILSHGKGARNAGSPSRLQMAPHHHGVAARVLLVLADHASSQADHVLRVDSSSARFVLAPALAVATPDLVIAPASMPIGWIPSHSAGLASASRARPPPFPSATLAQLRATVLLI